MAITVRELERGRIESEETYYYPIPANISVESDYASPQEAGARMAELVNEQLAQAKQQGEKVLLLLAGGSAFSAYDGIKPELLGSHVALGMADDRYVADPKFSNMEQFMQTALYQRAVAAGSDIIDSRQQYAEPLQVFADRYDRQIMKYVGEKRKIILVLGMGGTGNAEGHVAGIAPDLNPYDNTDAYYKLFGPANQTRAVEGYHAGGKITPIDTRVTITPNFITNIMGSKDTTILLTTGDAKARAVRESFNPMGTVQQIPGRVMQLLRGRGHVILDRPAASQLRSSSR